VSLRERGHEREEGKKTQRGGQERGEGSKEAQSLAKTQALLREKREREKSLWGSLGIQRAELRGGPGALDQLRSETNNGH